MEPIEAEGRDIQEAVESALSRSGKRRDQVEVTVLQEGSSGFMGLGAKPARVRLTEKLWGSASPAPAAKPAPRPPERRSAPRPAPRPEPRREEPRRPEPKREEPRREERAPRAALGAADSAAAVAAAEKLVLELLGLMGIAAPTASSSWDPELERVKISVESQDASLLVGRDGRVLESLQFLTTLMLSRAGGAPVAVQVDALSYWEKREQSVLDEARRAVETVKATGKPVRLEPMDSSMRRLIHRTLGANPEVTTASEGEGAWRKLVIRARKAA
ncbi:MAG: Jag N-terminal domain-containing protein [Elusimicrobiota bacterium]|nr:MAG: Jag N-terminal domain-containing protein [Elusimicrobiota bacterium]